MRKRDTFGRATRALTWLRPGLVAVVGVVTLGLVAIYMLPGDRTFVVETTTLGSELRFDTDASLNTWRIAPGALICRLVDVPGTPPSSSTHSLCPASDFSVELSDNAIAFQWPAGAALEALATPDGGLAIFVKDLADEAGLELGGDSQPLFVDDIIILSPQTFALSGSLPFSGLIDIGAEAASGARNLLVSGKYAVRERLLGRSNLITVATGDFYRGDKVSFQQQDGRRPVPVFGFISANNAAEPNDRQVPFHVIAYTELGHSTMLVDRFGTVRARITSDWTRRAVNDPVLIGGTVILTLVSLFATILGGLIRDSRKKSGRSRATRDLAAVQPVQEDRSLQQNKQDQAPKDAVKQDLAQDPPSEGKSSA